MHPFLLAGIGFNDNIAEYSYGGGSSSLSESQPMVAIGGGVAFPLGNKLDFTVKAKLVEVLASGGTFSFLPISAGLQFN